jgi:hypothetical protein
MDEFLAAQGLAFFFCYSSGTQVPAGILIHLDLCGA